MPYKIVKKPNGMFRVINAATGKVHAENTTKENAEAQVRLLHGVEHGMKPKK